MSKDLIFQAVRVSTESTYDRSRENNPLIDVEAEIPDSMVERVLGNFEIEEVIAHFGKLDILEHIGEEFIADWLADN